jgi:glycosyltransferase involved in cell wall biosynthesis
MRVAVVLEPSLPQVGGGHTLQADLLAALGEIAGETPHRFVLVGPPEHLEAPGAAGGLDHVPVRYGLVDRGLSAVERAARNVAGFARKGTAYVGDPRLERAVTGARADCIWYPTPYAPVLDVPFVATVWDLAHRLQPHFPEVSQGREWAGREAGFATTLRRAALIVTGTEQGRADIERLYQVPSERVRVVALPTPRYALAAPDDTDAVLRRHGLERGYLFYPAQLWPHKNHVALLHALVALRARHGLAPTLVLAGSDRGNLAAVQACAADLGVAAQLRVLGFVPQAELPALYRGAGALAFASFFGPDNLPPLEAMALGCPVVAADVPGAREQLGDAALFADPRAPEAIAAALATLLTDQAAAAALVERGHARAARWTGRDYVRQIFGILDELALLVRCWRPA